jgi:hypothetical protein
MRPQRAAEVAALVFLAQAAFAVIHRLSGGEYRGFTHEHNVVIDLGLAAIWLSSVVAVTIRRSFPLFFVAMVGAAVSLIHGLMFSVASHGKGFGVPFLVASVLLGYLLKHSVPAWDAPTAVPAEAPRVRSWRLFRPRHA